MNLFDMILKNAPSREVLFSSIFNYFVDPNETHGLKWLFLNEIFKHIPIDKKSLPKISEDSAIEIIPEEPLKDDKGKTVGRADSYIECKILKNGNTAPFIIATEIKILDASSNNTDSEGNKQLDRYYDALDALDTDFYLIYLIPSIDSRQCIGHFKNLIDNNKTANNIFMMYWRKPKKSIDKEPDNYVVSISFEEMIEELLRKEMIGEINPISTEIKYILKSLKRTIANNFNRAIAFNQRFLNRNEFLEAIGEQHTKIFVDYIEKESASKGLSVRSSNTTIGVPYESSPQGFNTLFRIRTCNEYFPPKKNNIETNKVSGLIIELNKKRYWNDIDELVKTLNGLIDRRETEYCTEEREEKSHFHQNGKDDEEVILLIFKKEINLKNEVIESKIRKFFEKAKEVWEKS